MSLALFSAPQSASAKAASDLLRKIGCGAAAAQPSNQRLLPVRSKKTVILAIGSSSTSGAGAQGDAYPRLLQQELNRRRGKRRSVAVVAKGVPGETAGGALARLQKAIETAKPDLLIWQLGTNDALKKVSLAVLRETIEIGAALARARDLPIVLVDPQYFPKIAGDAHFEAVVALIAQLATELDAPLIRRFERMRVAETIGPGAVRALLAPDGLHMSPLGHRCLALDLAQAISPRSSRASGR